MFRTFFCLLMLLVAGQATAYTWDQLIDSEKDLCVYFNGGLQASRYDGADSLKTKWVWGRPGVKIEVRNLDSGNVIRLLAEGEVADTSLTSVYLEQELQVTGYSYRFSVGQFLSPPLNMIPTPIQRMTLGAPDATRRFSKYVPGGLIAAQKQLPRGHVLAEIAYFERSKEPKYDAMFSDFQELEYGKNVRRVAYHLAFKYDVMQLEAGYEQDVGHALSLSGDISWLQSKVGMSSFQRQSGEAPLNVFFAESTVWVLPDIALVGRLDFGNEVEEASQLGVIWKHHGQEKDGLVGLYWQPSTETVSLLLSGAIKW